MQSQVNKLSSFPLSSQHSDVSTQQKLDFLHLFFLTIEGRRKNRIDRFVEVEYL